MAEIGVSVAAKVAEYLVDPVIRPLGYLFNHRRNITDLNQQIERLDLARDRLQRSVEEANRQGDEIHRDVLEWLTYAEGIFQRREDFNEDARQASKSCFYFKSRYQLSKKAKNQAAEIVDKIQEAHNFDGRVSYRPPPPPPPPFISSASFQDYEAFQSRESTFNQIMEALINEDLSMIGVWGMGGVGKTTLVKQVAKQAEEHKLFHKVVMALNISQTPNIAEIQGKIASMLGFEFKKKEDRAVRLRQSLKKQGKILVILDDIWGKIELGEIGIPYGDDHKGCKLLLTSRERWVLDTDMGTQKEFHVRHLNEEEAWSLFKRTAGDSVESLELRPIAVDVVKECEGLPIAIVTIAKALKKDSVPVWENALEELRRSAPTNIRGVSKNVYSCLELSYNHLEGNEAKSLFLLCALLGDGDISMDRLLQHAMGLNLFKGIYSWDKATNKLITLVGNLKASSLLLDGEDKEDEDCEKSLFFDGSMLLRMHDVVRDVARSIASKDPHQFVVKEAVGVEEEWQWMDECRNCTRISLKCKNIDKLPQGLVCPKLEFFLLDSSNDDEKDDDDDDDEDEEDDDYDSYLKIPDAFFQDTKQLRVLDLSEVSLAPSPSSLGFLSNLRTLCLNQCRLQDIAVIGDLKRLQVLCLAESDIEELPKEMMQLSDLRVLDLRNCDDLKVIPRNVISSLSRLEYLSMEGCRAFKWEKEGFNSGERINNACVSELKHLSGLRTLEVEVRDPSLLPEVDVLFDNLHLTRYSILIGDHLSTLVDMPNDEHKVSRRLKLNKVKRLHMANCSKLLKRSQVLGLKSLNDTKDVVYELDKEGFVELKYLGILECRSIQYILHSSTSVEWAPPPNTFRMLERLDLCDLGNLEAVCDGPIPMGFFGNLRILELQRCERLKYVFSLPTQHNGRESLAFPRLQVLKLENLPEVISFYSIGSSGSEESVTFFNQQITFPSLEILTISRLHHVRALWHNQLTADSFPKLRQLNIKFCNKLLNIFPSNNLKGLQSLQILEIQFCDALEEIFDLDGFLELKRLTVTGCGSIQYILHSSTLVEWAPPPNTFCMLEHLDLFGLDNLEAVCDGPIPMGFFGNLRILSLECCERLKYVFSVPTQHDGNESFTFPQLQELTLRGSREVISFYSIGRSSGSEESVTFFNQQITFPSLEILTISRLHHVRALWHNQLTADSFPKLRQLKIGHCDKLLNIFPSNNLKGLQSLQILEIQFCDALEEIFYLDGFLELKSLVIHGCPSIQYILYSSTSVEWAPPPMLEDLDISMLDNLEAVCDGPIPMGFFGNLRRITLRRCSRLKHVFSVPTQHGRESLAFPQLRQLILVHLPEVISFYSIGRSSGSEESMTFFNQQITFPSLEILTVHRLHNVRALCHNQLSADSFPKLRELNITSCDKLLNIFPSNNLKALQSLQILQIEYCNDLEEIFYLDGFLELKSLNIHGCPSIQYILHSSTSLEWAPPPMLEDLHISMLDNLEAVCDGPIPMGFFGNLRILSLECCESLRYVFSVPTQHDGNESFTFPQLQELTLSSLPEVISFYSIGRSSGSEESMTFFNQQITFPSLEILTISRLHHVRALCHNQLSADSFPKLRELNITSCGKLLNIFPSNNLKALQSLQILQIEYCNDLEEIFYLDGFLELKSLNIHGCPSIQYILHSSTSVEWAPPPMLEDLHISMLDNLEAVYDGPIPMGFFGNLRILSLECCERLKYVFSVPTQHDGNESFTFPQLQELTLSSLPEVISFYSIGRSSGSEESMTFFNQQITFPSLEILTISRLHHVRALWHNQLTADSFPKLRQLNIKFCNKLLNIFPSNNLKGLQSLQILEIQFCDALEEIFDLDGFLELKRLTVTGCGSIQYILHSSTLVEWAPPPNTFCMLEHLDLFGLDNLEAVCDGPIPMGFFGNLRILSLECCERLKYVFSVPTQHDGNESFTFPQLQELTLRGSREVISFYSIGRSSGSEESVTFFNQQVAFPALESLTVLDLANVRSLWHNQLLEDSFSKLKYLYISSCNKLLNVFPLFVVKALVQLEDLLIHSCGVLEAIVANENEGDEPTDDEIDFTNLKRLDLYSLPNLKSFCSGRFTFRFPSLNEMKVLGCPKMEFFCKGVLDTPRLKGIQIINCYKECWEGDLNTTIHKKFMEQNAQGYKEEDSEELNCISSDPEESDSINSDPREEDFKED